MSVIFLILMFFVEGRELVRILLAAGANPTAQDPLQYRTALHTAAMANDVELVKVI
jgi:E3 ubiquitin-protein ligase KEG